MTYKARGEARRSRTWAQWRAICEAMADAKIAQARSEAYRHGRVAAQAEARPLRALAYDRTRGTLTIGHVPERRVLVLDVPPSPNGLYARYHPMPGKLDPVRVELQATEMHFLAANGTRVRWFTYTVGEGEQGDEMARLVAQNAYLRRQCETLVSQLQTRDGVPGTRYPNPFAWLPEGTP